MKKPIVGIKKPVGVCWELPNDITLYQCGNNLTTYFGADCKGVISKKLAQELFEVILYPPGSEPSPESADPTDRARMRIEAEKQWDIPRVDLDNGDWN